PRGLHRPRHESVPALRRSARAQHELLRDPGGCAGGYGAARQLGAPLGGGGDGRGEAHRQAGRQAAGARGCAEDTPAEMIEAAPRDDRGRDRPTSPYFSNTITFETQSGSPIEESSITSLILQSASCAIANTADCGRQCISNAPRVGALSR